MRRPAAGLRSIVMLGVVLVGCSASATPITAPDLDAIPALATPTGGPTLAGAEALAAAQGQPHILWFWGAN